MLCTESTSVVCCVAQYRALLRAWCAGSKRVPVRVEDVEMLPDPPMSGHNFTLLLPAETSEIPTLTCALLSLVKAYCSWPRPVNSIRLLRCCCH